MQRRRRYERTKERPSISLTDDDDAILLHVYRHRLIDANQLRQLFPNRSAQKLGRRLTDLYDAGYIERPQLQRERPRRPGGGSWPEVYALDRLGAERVRSAERPVSVKGWKQKNERIRGASIAHTVNTTQFMVDVECATREEGHVGFIHGEDIPRRDRKAVGSLPTSAQAITADIAWNGLRGREGTAPDRVLGLHYPQNPEGKQFAYFFLEIDQGTEVIEPLGRKLRSSAFFRDTSLLRKFVVYASAYQQKSYQRQFEMRSFRVLTVTTNRGRAERMQETVMRHFTESELRVPPGLFLFTDWETWQERAQASVPCQTANGSEIDLLNP